MTWEQLNKTIDDNQERIVAKHAQTFHADIIGAWPVDQADDYKGLHSRDIWFINKKGNTWTVSNPAPYAGILFIGRVGNRGSFQLENGGFPILKANLIRMERDLKANLL